MKSATPHPRSGAEARRIPCPRGSGQEELPRVRGQGRRPREPGCNSAGTTERSYPTSEVRGGGRESQAATAQERLRGATQHLRSGAVAERARLQQRRSSQEELPHVRGQGRRPGGETPRPRSGGCAGTGGPRGATPRSRSEGRQ